MAFVATFICFCVAFLSLFLFFGKNIIARNINIVSFPCALQILALCISEEHFGLTHIAGKITIQVKLFSPVLILRVFGFKLSPPKCTQLPVDPAIGLAWCCCFFNFLPSTQSKHFWHSAFSKVNQWILPLRRSHEQLPLWLPPMTCTRGIQTTQHFAAATQALKVTAAHYHFCSFSSHFFKATHLKLFVLF